MSTGTEGLAPTDGRAVRRARSKDAAVDAILDLVAEGVGRPTAQQIAERSGLSLRTVFRLADDLDALHAAAVLRQGERIAELLEPLPLGGSLAERVDALVTSRATVHEAITPTRRLGLRLAPSTPAVADGLARSRRFFRRQVRDLFAPELAALDEDTRGEVLDALDQAASWSTWDALRTDRGLSRPRAERVVHRTVTSLLTAAAT